MMNNFRIIPALLINNGQLYKGMQFVNHVYIGDPLNAIRVFNEKEVDELLLLDISASSPESGPDFDVIRTIVSEAFIPVSYGGGIRSVAQVEKLFSSGVEKVVINTAGYFDPSLITAAANVAGSQSIVVSIDAKRRIFGKYEVYVKNGTFKTGYNPVDYARMMEDYGAGELIVTSIDREGTRKGFDVELLAAVSEVVDIPVIGHGGAGSLEDFSLAAKNSSVSALAAGTFFVFHGRHRAVLISYPTGIEIQNLAGGN